MALSILDGTQTATTLSTVVTSGQHITAHTIVSLGTQAITDMRSAVSGSVVSVSSLPAISGTVTANVGNPSSIIGGGYNDLFAIIDDSSFRVEVTALPAFPALSTGTNRIGVVTIGGGTVTIGAGTAQIGSVTVGNSVTIGSLPAISGTVTANGGDFASPPLGAYPAKALRIGFADDEQYNAVGLSGGGKPLPVILYNTSEDSIGSSVSGSIPLVISGTVTASLAISATAITSGSFASLTSATLVPGNVARKMATVYNLGAGQLFVNAGATATTLGGGFMVALSSGDYFECGFTTTTLSALFASAGTASWVSH